MIAFVIAYFPIIAVVGLSCILALKVIHRRDMKRYGINSKWYY